MSDDNLVVRFDPSELTLEDLEDFYNYTGMPLEKALKPVKQYDDDGNLITDSRGKPKMAPDIVPPVMTALVWLMRRAEDPSFDLAQAKRVKPKVLEIVIPEDDAVGEDESGNA